MLKKLTALFILTISIVTQASIPEDMTDAEYQAIVNQVITDKGYFDAIAVEDAIGDWLLNQGVPNVDGDLVDSGSCNPCSADGQTTSSASSGKASGPVFHQPRNIKVKAKKNPDGTFKSVVKVKWKRPKKLDASLDYVLDHYLVYISKNNQSYEIFKKKAKFKRNGKPKKKQSLKFKNRGTADYSVQVQAVYVPTDERPSSTDKSVNTLSLTNKSSSQGSSWPPATNFTVIKEPTQVMHLTGAIKTCLNDNGHADSKNLLQIRKDLYCIGYNLQDSDISQMSLLQRVMAIDISNNPNVTNIGPLSELNYLFFLNISQNPNIVNSDYSIFEEVKYLRMQNMGLSSLPDFSTHENLDYLDIRNNQITSGFIRLPSTLTTLLMDENGVNTCERITGGTNNKIIESISVSADGINISDCVDILGLKYLTITEGDFESPSQNITEFNQGLCGLTVESTNLTELTGQPALQGLTLKNNVNLKRVQPLITRISTGHTKRPHFLTITEDDSKLLCSDRFQAANLPFSAIQGTEVPVGCPDIRAAIMTDIPQNCSPDAVSDLRVYSDNASSTRFIKWSDHADADLWGVTHYKIFGISNNESVSYDTEYRTGNNEYILTKDSLIADQYRVVACTANKCGYEAIVVEGAFRDGLSVVTYAEANQELENPDQFKITLTYNNQASDIEARPSYFWITSDMNPALDVKIENCPTNTGCVNGTYTSEAINYNNAPGSSVNVRACNGYLGCGAAISVDTSRSITGSDIPVPQWQVNGHVLVFNGNDFELSWRVNDTAERTQNIDYYEITEWKPIARENGGYLHTLNGRAEFHFYVERDKTLPVGSVQSLALSRITRGFYDYDIRACQRNRGGEDICSEKAGGIYQVEQPGSQNSPWLNCKPLNPGFDVTDNCYSGSESTYDFWIPPQITLTEQEIDSLLWYEMDNTYHLSWKPKSGNQSRNTDYFYIEQLSADNNEENNCALSINGVEQKHSLKLKVNYSDLLQDEDGNKMWSTSEYCSDLGQGTKWRIKACKLGHGCSPALDVDLSNTAQQDQQPTLNMPRSSTIFGSEILSSTNGGPGDLLPGMWWNRDLAGTGWHFYWASNLRLPSSHPHHGNTYDLVGYWFAYKQDKLRGVWTPTWFETRLKSIEVSSEVSDPSYGYNGCFEGDILHNNTNNNPDTQRNAGNLLVCFDDVVGAPDNTTATLIFDINQQADILAQVSESANLGPYETISGGRLKLEIKDFSIGIINPVGNTAINTPNDDDHYSGLWQNNIDTPAHTTVSLLSWLEKGLEVSTLATYDTTGEPIWLQAVNCSDPDTCASSGAGYFDQYAEGQSPNDSNQSLTMVGIAYGFNPIAARPESFNFTNVIENGGAFYYGTMGRCLSNGLDDGDPMRFRKGKLWYDIRHELYSDNNPGNNIDDRIFDHSTGVVSTDNCDNPAMIELTKTASLHDISYKINGYNDETIQICDPNNTDNPNYCEITFQWYTDDDFQSITPYYSVVDENTGQDSAYLPLLDLCLTSIPNEDYVVEQYVCDLTHKPGQYTFQLRKDNYGSNAQDVVIAESASLRVLECQGDCMAPGGVIDFGEPVGDAPKQSIQAAFAHADGHGPIPGGGGVSGGAATYNVPLAIPPGRNGMTPSVSVNYSSKGGNGSLGIGWSISAGSSIYRCPQTIAQDGVNHAVDFSFRDKLCLDGQRLMITNEGLPDDGGNFIHYWSTGAEYFTEQNSFAKVTKTATGFEVKTKSGRLNTYLQQGSQQTTWQLIKEEDTFGNNIVYEYDHTSYGTNEVLLKEIRYTGDNSGEGNRKVIFNYLDRDKAYATKYLAGEPTETTQKLDKIEVRTPLGLFRTYEFDYVENNPENLLLLNTITEKAKGLTSSQRIIMDAQWQGQNDYNLHKPRDGSFAINPIVMSSTDTLPSFNAIAEAQTDNFSPEVLSGTQGLSGITTLRVGADINGDGSKEVLAVIKDETDALKFSLLSYSSNGALKGQIDLDIANNAINPFSLVNGSGNADFNGDGITDLMIFPTSDTSNYQIAAWKGDALPNPDNGPVNILDHFRLIDTGIPKTAFGEFNINMTTADIDSDGYPDLVYTRLVDRDQCFGNGNLCENVVYYRRNLGLSQCLSNITPCTKNPEFEAIEREIDRIDYSNFSSSASDSVALKDFNGDGYPDVVITNAAEGLRSVQFFEGLERDDNTDTFTFMTKSVSDLDLLESGQSTLRRTYHHFTDLNADGLEDFLYLADPNDATNTPAQWFYQLNTGDVDAGLFGPKTPMGSGNFAGTLPSTKSACNASLFGGNENATTSDDKCEPALSQGLVLADVNSDGINDILLPNRNDVLIDICVKAEIVFIGGNVILFDANNQSHNENKWKTIATVCSSTPYQDHTGANDQTPGPLEAFNFYSRKGVFASMDNSVYGHHALIIEAVKSDSDVVVNLEMAGQEIPTIYKKIGKNTSTGDFFGDGDQDYTNRLVCPYVPNGPAAGGSLYCDTTIVKFNEDLSTTGGQVLEDYAQDNYQMSFQQAKATVIDNIVVESGEQGSGEFFLTRNDSTVSGLMASVTKPTLDLTTQWVYKPLSTDPDERFDFPLYAVPDRLSSDSYVDEENNAGEHFYFNSSMYVVSEMYQTNNYGGNSINEYAYEEAVYNNKGRGFQGFRKISVRSNPYEGEICDDGDTACENRLNRYETLSESTFHQVFPLAGKLESVKVSQQKAGELPVVINEESYCYAETELTAIDSCNDSFSPTNSKVVYYPLVEKHSTSRELNNNAIVSTLDMTLEYDQYGNIKKQSDTLTTKGLRTEITETINEYNPADEDAWWIDQLKKTTVIKSASVRGSDDVISNDEHTTYSAFYWVDDNTGARKIDCQFTYIHDAVNQPQPSGCNYPIASSVISKSTFDYDGFGNVKEFTTSAWADVYDAQENIIKGVQDRVVETNYDTANNYNGYFPTTITRVNGEASGYSQHTYLTYDIGTGQVTETTLPDMNFIINNYDDYGFKVSEQLHDRDSAGGENDVFSPMSHTAMHDCMASTCSTAQGYVDAVRGLSSRGELLPGSPQLKYYSEQRQDGQAHVVTWYDSNNNAVLIKTMHSDNASTTSANVYNHVANITSPTGVNVISTQPFTNNLDLAYPTVKIADAQGRVIEKITTVGDLSDPLSFDKRCQLTTQYIHSGTSTTINVSHNDDEDNSNNCATTDQSELNGMQRTYDVSGKLLSTRDANFKTVNYHYDASGNPSELIDAAGNTIETTFDALGRKSKVEDPNMGIKYFHYNGFGEVATQKYQEEPHATYYIYDSLGRIVEQYSNVGITHTPTSDALSYRDTYSYDSIVIGQMTQMKRESNLPGNACGTNCFAVHYKKVYDYNLQNRLKSEETILRNALTDIEGPPDARYITEYHYDGYYNRVKQVIYDNRYSVENRYTRHGSLSEQVNVLTGAQLMVVDGWNHRGQEKKRKFKPDINGNTDMYSETDYYPSSGQIAEIRNYSTPIGNNNTNGLEKLSYQYDVWGNITRQELDRSNTGAHFDATAVETLSYDKLHRLTSVAQGSQTKTYQYDSVGLGNIKQKSDFGSNYQYGTTGNNCNGSIILDIGIAGPNAVTQVSLINSIGTMRYNYDDKGNRIQDCMNGAQTGLYKYDYNNLLVESEGTLGSQPQNLKFNYGPDNQRYRKYDLVNKEITLYANKDYEQIFDVATRQIQQRKYYLTSYLTITQDSQNRSNVNFMQMDRLGSTTQILDEQGFVLHTKSYDAFGRPRKGDWSDYGLFESKLDFTNLDENGTQLSSIDITKRGFTNHEHLDEMQLIHMNGRMYDYNNGRFLSVDPFIIKPTSTQALNPYTYIFNNPLSGTDPSGYLPVVIPIIIEVAGWASAAWGAAEAGEALGTGVAQVATGEKSLSEAAIDTGAQVGQDLIITATGGLVAKSANKFIPDEVKDRIASVFNGNKNNDQGSKDSINTSNSDLESQPSLLKNSEEIKEGLQFEADELKKAIDSGENVTGRNRLVPQNGVGNVNGNRMDTDQLIKNEDGTFKIVETKRSSSTPLSKGQEASRKHVEEGDGIFETRTTQDSQGLTPGDEIKVTEFERRDKIQTSQNSGNNTSSNAGNQKKKGSNILIKHTKEGQKNNG